MNKKNLRGLALMILGVILALGSSFELVYFWYAGIAVGLIGLILMFSNDK